MCGICGVWNRGGSPIDPGRLAAMRDSMAHRGPDGAGCVLLDPARRERPVRFISPNEVQETTSPGYQLGLGHRRLAIIDLRTGAQPMSSEDGSVWIVFNGEIYNFRELREELRSLGRAFRTTSDTEVILHAWREYGETCPTRLNGIFAFAIWDAKARTLFLARDHFGVKPLYWLEKNGRVLFGSEIKAILTDPAVPRELDLEALDLCLTFRHTPSPWTLFKGIRKLPPGHSLTVTQTGVAVRSFWDDPRVIDRNSTEKEWIARLRAAVEGAVVRQMVSDVPIAVSLSAGVDSTTVLALMSRHSSTAVEAFTVGFEGREAESEVGPARASASQFGASFHEQVIRAADYGGFMDRYLWHLEEPIGNDSAAAYFFVADMARRSGIKVLLNGQGADEAFAGYKRYLGAAYNGLLRWAAVPPFRHVVPALLGARPLGERYRRFLAGHDASEEDERFLSAYSILPRDVHRTLFRCEARTSVDTELPRRYVGEQLSRAPEGSALERMTFVDARTSLPDNLLLCEDKMAMAASVEARVPFLDLELMEVAERIPGKLKLRGLRDKYIHRRACEPWVGKQVTSRAQVGFDNAVDLWFRAHLGRELEQALEGRDSFAAEYLDVATVRRLLDEHRSGRRDHQKVLFLLLSLESWHRAFFATGGRP